MTDRSVSTGRPQFAVLGAAGLAALAIAGCGGSSDATAGTSASAASGGGASTQLGLVAYSTPKKAYDALTAAFAQTAGGKGVSFGSSFGASGSQSRAVDSGQPADVVAFSTTPDMTRLVKDNLVASSWDANPEKGFSSDSVVVMVVHKGNPKHITGWDQLIKPGVDVITPNPSTSGSRSASRCSSPTATGPTRSSPATRSRSSNSRPGTSSTSGLRCRRRGRSAVSRAGPGSAPLSA